MKDLSFHLTSLSDLEATIAYESKRSDFPTTAELCTKIIIENFKGSEHNRFYVTIAYFPDITDISSENVPELIKARVAKFIKYIGLSGLKGYTHIVLAKHMSSNLLLKHENGGCFRITSESILKYSNRWKYNLITEEYEAPTNCD